MLSNNPVSQKKGLRNRIRGLRDSLTSEDIDSKSHAIQNQLWQLIKEREFKAIMFYIAFGSEVRTQECITQCINNGIIVVVPIFKQLTPSRLLDICSELAKSSYGVPEPKPEFVRPFPPGNIELVVVPGIAFDEKGFRIGYGAGYYDCFLNLCPDALLVGLAYELQIVESIFPTEWDIPVHKIITESRIISFCGK